MLASAQPAPSGSMRQAVRWTLRPSMHATTRPNVESSSSVKQSLDRLREALESGAELDAGLRADLAALDADIRRTLGTQPPAEAQGLAERVREMSLRFAQQHPTAAAVLRELGVLLEGIGA